MRAKKSHSNGSAEKTVRAIRRATRRRYAAMEKIRIVLQGLRGLSLEAVDATVIDHFLRHDCDYREAGSAAVWFIPLRNQVT